MIETILKEIMAMNVEEFQTFKLAEDRFLFVENWSCDGEEWFTSLELNSGEEIDNEYLLDEVLECMTYDFGDEENIRRGIEYMILCGEYR